MALRLTVLMLFMSVFAGTCLADYSPLYELYATQDMDSNLNISQTVILDGTTTGDCYRGFVWISNCPSDHVPNIQNSISGVGGYGGWYEGPSQSMFDYISFQTTTTIAGTPGAEYDAVVDGQVYCVTAAAAIYESGQSTSRLGLKDVQSRVFSYSLSCSTAPNTFCGTSAGCVYSDLVAKCNGGTLNPDYMPGEVKDCRTDGRDPPSPPENGNLWGFDVFGICLYYNGTGVLVCGYGNPITRTPFNQTELINPNPPFFTPGACTFNGTTQ
jgi:hypothetical protein